MKEIKMTPLLQKDYGGSNDCTLTSITAIINNFLQEKTNVSYIYNNVEEIAKQHGFTNKKGTSPFRMKKIYDKCLKCFNIPMVSKNRFLKGIGFTFGTIKKAIDDERPVILSMWNDGTNTYKNHTVTVVGYDEESKMLFILDNWNNIVKTIDYSKLSFISSINW